jgi:hypothetical protein
VGLRWHDFALPFKYPGADLRNFHCMLLTDF